jgi:hypothetical protein
MNSLFRLTFNLAISPSLSFCPFGSKSSLKPKILVDKIAPNLYFDGEMS